MSQDIPPPVPGETPSSPLPLQKNTPAVTPADASDASLQTRDTWNDSSRAGAYPESGKLFLWFFLGLLLFSLWLLYYLFQPFLHTIILACIFTAISMPVYKRCLRMTGNRPVPAALAVMLGITFLVVVPICIFVAGLIPQAGQSISAVNQWLAGKHLGNMLNTHIQPLLELLRSHFPDIDISLTDIRSNLLGLSRNAGQYLLGSASVFLGNTVLFFGHLLLILLIMFFLLIEGETMVKRLAYLAPMKPRQTAVVIESLRRMSRAVLVGGFCVAALQGLVAGIGFAIVGIPALFWGTVMVFAAFVPVVGTGLIWVPAIICLLIMEEWTNALFLAIWCGIGVTSIDSILRPILMRGESKIHIIFIFLAILGGINVFGMIGLIYGPLILGLVAVMINIYAEEYQDILQRRYSTDDNALPPCE